ncbi:MAG: S8 family serine peptidase [Fimbriimonadaceae bacterium]|nr:S8 family serine peptidase [Fimbriimonadaceae bacterium]QYK56956.1 MAG: S8 family serine peptidase [Fimbriimonadaceae bacterium]
MNPLFAAMLVLGPSGSWDVRVERVGAWTSLNIGGGAAFHKTHNSVSKLTVHNLPGTAGRLATWQESAGNEQRQMFAVSLDGTTIKRVGEDSGLIRTVHGDFDPTKGALPMDSALRAGASVNTYLVQFHGQTLAQFRDAIVRAGGKVLNYVPDNAYAVILPEGAVEQVRSMDFVRYVGKLDPGLRLLPEVKKDFLAGKLETKHYDIVVSGDDAQLKAEATMAIKLLGGKIIDSPREGQVIEAELTNAQVGKVAAIDGVTFVAPTGEPSSDMDNVRIVSGANYVETVGNYRGQGVNIHDIDAGFVRNHIDYASRVTFRNNPGIDSHGTATLGTVVGDGTGNPAARGMMPLANGIATPYTVNWSGPARLALTQDTVNVFNCVVETNSWGDSLTGSYTGISSYMDEIVFKTDLVILNSMSNAAGNTVVRPQAWGKNIVAIGGVYHFNNANLADDRWQNGASIGPAADGRIKPDLCFYYDQITTTYTTSPSGYGIFSGTSAATPMSAGTFGLAFQMWGDGIFGNTNLGSTVFDNRMKNATARALMINTAAAYSNQQLDIERRVQGWGLPNVKNVFDNASKMLVVDENTNLEQLQSKTYQVYVAPGSPSFKATMAYTDYWAVAFANPTRVNEVSLKVVAPDSTVYWGNNGMGGSANAGANDLPNVTTPGGSADTRNTIQNVFVNNPQSGVWTIVVTADNLPQDGVPETPGVIDQSYGLVVSGAEAQAPAESITDFTPGSIESGGLSEVYKSDNSKVILRTPLRVGGNAVLNTGTITTHTVSDPNPSSLTLVAEVETNIANLPLRLRLFNFQANAWENFEMGSTPLSKGRFSASPTGDLQRFIDGNGRVRAGVTVERNTANPAPTVWKARVDHVRLFING